MSSALEKANDPLLAERYARKTAARLGADPIQAINAFKRLAKETPQPRQREDDDALPQEPDQPQIPRPSHPELWILKLALLNDDSIEWLAAHLDFHWIEHPQVRTILEHRLTPHHDNAWPSPAQILNDLEDVSAQNLLTEASTDPLKLADPANVLRETLLRLRNVYIDRQLIQIATQMADPNANIAELLTRQKSLRAARTTSLTPVSDTSEF